MSFWMMIDHAQKDATIRISITSLTVNVARANSDHMEKSISCANARVSASIYLPFASLGRYPTLSRGKLPDFQGESHAHPRHHARLTGRDGPAADIRRRRAGSA